MADFYGVLDNLLNTEYSNAPYWMREEATYQAFKIYDKMFQPVVAQFLPKAPAPDMNGGICSVEDPFFQPVAVDPQRMSRLYAPDERVKALGVGFKREKYQSRLTKEWIPPSKTEEYTNRFKAGFLDMRNAFLTQMGLDSIARRQEFEGINVLACNSTTVRQYSDQPLTRFKEFDASQTSASAADYLSGATWDSWDSDPMHDIEKIKLHMRIMAGVPPTNGLIGPNTAFSLENNKKVIENQKFFVNQVQKPVALNIKGIIFDTISQLTAKDSAVNAGRVGYPGLGNIKEDNWSDRNKFNFMNETISSVTYEYALFLAGQVGNTFCTRTNPNHGDVMTPYGHSWQDPETLKTYSNIQLGFAPIVQDYAKIIKVKKVNVKNV